MGRHSHRGVLTGEELNVVRRVPERYRPRHGIREGYADFTFEANGVEVVVTLNASNRFEQVCRDTGFLANSATDNVVPIRQAIGYIDQYGQNRFRVP